MPDAERSVPEATLRPQRLCGGALRPEAGGPETMRSDYRVFLFLLALLLLLVRHLLLVAMHLFLVVYCLYLILVSTSFIVTSSKAPDLLLLAWHLLLLAIYC